MGNPAGSALDHQIESPASGCVFVARPVEFAFQPRHYFETLGLWNVTRSPEHDRTLPANLLSVLRFRDFLKWRSAVYNVEQFLAATRELAVSVTLPQSLLL